jgi:hypothetical protein
MTNDPTDWHQTLARVSGQLVHGEQRVTTRELLTVHLGVPVTDRACRRLRRVMRELGWRGPRLMRWGKKTLKGYWRYPTVGLPVIVQEEPVVEVATTDRETLAPELERVTRLGYRALTSSQWRLALRLQRRGSYGWSSERDGRQSSRSKFIHTCCGTQLATSSPIKAGTPIRWRIIWVIAICNRRLDTLR